MHIAELYIFQTNTIKIKHYSQLRRKKKENMQNRKGATSDKSALPFLKKLGFATKKKLIQFKKLS